MNEASPNPEFDAKNSGWLEHLIELRQRLLWILAGIAVCAVILLPFANLLYTWLADPLLRHLPASSSMIAIDVATPVLIPFKLVFMLAVFISLPHSLYHIWAFVAPGLYQNEKRVVVPLLVCSTVLFYLGVAFAYFAVFPIVFGFIIGMAPAGVAVMTDIGRYLDFVIVLFFAFGAAFEIPVVTVLLVSLGVVSPERLAGLRPYIIVAAFVVGMLLTPPDVISQILLAIPMWLLFELGIVVAKRWGSHAVRNKHVQSE